MSEQIEESKRLKEIEEMTGLPEGEKRELFADQILLEFLYESLFPLDSLHLQWMDIDDGKHTERKIAVLTKMMHEEEISEREWNEVLDPERYEEGLTW